MMKLLNSLNDWLNRLPGWLIAVAAAVVLAIIGVLDFITGEEMGLSLFYVIPVMLVAWYLGRAAGAAASIVAAATWYAADAASGKIYPNIAIPLWNTAMRLGFLLLIGLLASLIKVIFEQERDLARTDSLTGVLNTRQFYELAGGELERARRYGRPLSVAYMDLDSFKEVNDVYGHGAGDDLLCFVADILKSRTRSSDIVARMGGDEFVVLMPESQDMEAGKMMERLRQSVMDGMPQYGFPVTLSVGLITYYMTPDSVEEMVHEADTLMYHVKHSTKNALWHEVIRNGGDRERMARLRPGQDIVKGAVEVR